jgi:hypothetical protein
MLSSLRSLSSQSSQNRHSRVFRVCNWENVLVWSNWNATEIQYFEQRKAVPPPTLSFLQKLFARHLPVKATDKTYIRANVQDMIIIFRFKDSLSSVVPASGNNAG